MADQVKRAKAMYQCHQANPHKLCLVRLQLCCSPCSTELLQSNTPVTAGMKVLPGRRRETAASKGAKDRWEGSRTARRKKRKRVHANFSSQVSLMSRASERKQEWRFCWDENLWLEEKWHKNLTVAKAVVSDRQRKDNVPFLFSHNAHIVKKKSLELYKSCLD